MQDNLNGRANNQEQEGVLALYVVWVVGRGNAGVSVAEEHSTRDGEVNRN